MKYTQRSFNSAPSSQAYRDNYDRIFRSKKAPCSVHPHATGGEIKCIGLSLRYEGQPEEERYSEWARVREICTCGRDKGDEPKFRAVEG